MHSALASLYEYKYGRANSWLGFKAVLGGNKYSVPSDYKAIESGHCTGSDLNWATGQPDQQSVRECVQVWIYLYFM
ncbi:hypothetical protein DICVIV_14341 [Dictyocaulus viviparus]|uniref:Uncharacterized protein n=1 Tax=Dictyocaulus viviparus TaxID=29172 RepID=A0A0D8XBD2_DICVI|nr:hypothetical protein DICVIV_14341 [Dictyocaulus viviparus]